MVLESSSKNGKKIMVARASGQDRETVEDQEARARPEPGDEYNVQSHVPVASFPQQDRTASASHSGHTRSGTCAFFGH